MEMGPATGYTLRRNTVSITKMEFSNEEMFFFLSTPDN